MKKLIALVLSAMMVLSLLTACGGNDNSSSAGTPSNATSGEANNAAPEAAAGSSDLPAIEQGAFSAPIVLTSVGQSADMEIVSTLCSRANIDVYAKSLIMADELNGTYKTLILAVGGSSKGLGAAGIDADEELERAEKLIDKAKELGIQILVMHTGGSSRRGTLSDKFITPTFEKADGAIVVSEGDSDNFMRDILSANNTPSLYVEQAADILTALQTAFGL